MRINLEGVRRRREELVDRIKFGSDYQTSYEKQAQFSKLPVPRANNHSLKLVIQSTFAVGLVVVTLFLQQLSSPWAQNSLSFINEVVERDYNWQGVVEALPFDNQFFNFESETIPTGTGTDPALYNEYTNKFPSDPAAAPVFGPINSEQPVTENIVTNKDSLELPIKGLLVKRFTDEKPYLEFIALDNKNVISVDNGTVKQVGKNDQDETLIYIEGNGFTYVYGRVKDVKVKEGDTVTKGQSIATVSGKDEVELLLFQIIKDDRAIDPEGLLP